MNIATYLSAADRYLDKLLSKDLPYFPLSFAPRDPLSRSAVASAEKPSLKDLVLNHSRMALVGPPGSGKTRAARDLAKVFCCSLLQQPTSDVPVALYIPLRYLPGPIVHGMRWADLLVAPLNYTLMEFDCQFKKGEQLAQMLSGKRLILLIDGLNEISNHELVKVLNVLDTCPEKAHVVLTSRIREYPTEYKDYAVYDIRPLSFPDEVRGFLKHMIESQLTPWAVSSDILQACERDTVLRQLSTNPYLLSQLFHIARVGLPLPLDRTSLLDLVADNLIHEQSLDRITVEAFLMDLAGEMQFEKQVLKMNVGAIVSRHRGPINDSARLKNILVQLIDVRLLVRSIRSLQNSQQELHNDDEVGFHHQVFQEFFAGKNLYEQQLRSVKALGACRAIIRRHAKSRWNWEAICTAVVLLTMDGKPTARQLIRWLAHSHPNLSALIQSEVPIRAETFEYYTHINGRLIKRLKNTTVLWALWMPHCYNLLPALIIAGALVAIWSARHVDVASGISTGFFYVGQGLPTLIAFSLLVPVTYMLLLTAIYKWFDNVIFDRRVHPSLASLELLRFRGGREALRDLRERAEANIFIGGRMESWILSSPKIPLFDVHEGFVLKGTSGLPESRQDITDDWVKCLVDQLRAPLTEEAVRLEIVEALTVALRILGSDEALHMVIRDGLQSYLQQGAKGRVRRRVVAALGSEKQAASFCMQLVSHWRRYPGVWVIFAAFALTLAGATYFKWPLILNILAFFFMLIGCLSGLINLYKNLISNQDRAEEP